MESLLGFSARGAVVVASFVVIVESFVVSFVVCASPGTAKSSAARVPTSRAVVFFIARASSDRLEQRARPRALVHESPAERTAYSSFEMKNCNGYATALSCEAAIIMWTQPWGNAPIRWGGFSRRPSEGRNTYTVRNFFAEAWERCLRPGRLAQGIDDMPAAIAREPKPMAVSMEGVGTRGSREDPQERLGLVHAAEHFTAGSRKLQIALRCPDLRLELRGKWRHHPHGVEGNLPDVLEELDAYARLSHISSRWRMAARRAAAPRSRSLAIPHRACRGDGTRRRPGS